LIKSRITIFNPHEEEDYDDEDAILVQAERSDSDLEDEDDYSLEVQQPFKTGKISAETTNEGFLERITPDQA
jgi:hypothetical protein